MQPDLRDLLLNLPPTSAPTPSQRVVSASYRPWETPASAQDIVRTLWGRQPDAWMKDYRTSQLLALFSEEESGVAEGPEPEWRWGSRIALGPAQDLLFQEAPYLPDDSGKCYFRWRVVWQPATLYLEQHAPRWERSQVEPVFADGWSQALTLPGEQHAIRIAQRSDAQWEIELIVRPKWSAAQLYLQLRLLPLGAFWSEVAAAKGDPDWFRAWQDESNWVAAMRSLLLALLHLARR